MGAYRFQPHPVVTLFSLVALAILVTLGSWQLRRLEWKQDLIAQVEARVNAELIPFAEAVRRAEAGENMEYAPVVVEGRLRADQEARVFGTYDGQPGAYIFAPLETGDGAVYINRGFTPQKLLSVECFCEGAQDAGAVTGLLRMPERLSPPASWFRTKEKSAGGLWFVRNPELFAADAELDASSYYIDQFAVGGRDWPKGGTTRLDFSNRHLEYALTWFGLAAALAGVWIAFSLKKRE